MKKLILTMSMVLSLNANALEPDKIKHIGASTVISGMAYGFYKLNGFTRSEAYRYAFLTSMAVGIGKELIDDHIDRGDLAADALGSMLGPMFFIVWEF